MGAAETIMAIATIINGRKEKPEGRRTTLIVVTSSIVLQWMEELKKHTQAQHLGSICRYHAGSRIDSGSLEASVQTLMKYDVV